MESLSDVAGHQVVSTHPWVQSATTKCSTCDKVCVVTPVVLPFEFQYTCPTHGTHTISWNHELPPPQFFGVNEAQAPQMDLF